MFTTQFIENRLSNSFLIPVLMLMLVGYGSIGYAEGSSSNSPTKPASEVNRIIEIDVGKLRVVHTEDGRTMYVSENGRYAIVGDFFDMWQRRRIVNMDDLTRTVRTMDLKGAGFDVEKAVKFSLGKGEQRVTIFVDPGCGWCHRLIEEVNHDLTLQQAYTFDFVVVSVLGGQSVRLAQIFSCSTEKDEKKRLEAFLGGEDTIMKMPQQASGVCDLTDYQQTASASRQLSIKSVPLIIAPDGRFVKGKPKSLLGFLQGTDTNDGQELSIKQGLKPTVVDPQYVEIVEKAVQKKSANLE